MSLVEAEISGTSSPQTQPHEPLYTLSEAARLAGFVSAGALRVYLHRHPHVAPRRYRDKRFDKRRPRMLTKAEIDRLRGTAVK